MKFVNECLDHYSTALVFLLWIPLMIIALPIGLAVVCMKLSYQVMNDMFGVEDE